MPLLFLNNRFFFLLFSLSCFFLKILGRPQGFFGGGIVQGDASLPPVADSQDLQASKLHQGNIELRDAILASFFHNLSKLDLKQVPEGC